MTAPNIISQSIDVLMQKKLNELAVYLERELDSKPELECKHESAKICALNQRFPIDSSDGKPPEGKSLHRLPTNRKTKHQTKKSVSSNESTPRSSIPVTFAQEEDVNSSLSRAANCCTGADFSNTRDAACHAGFLDMEEELNVLKVRNLELLERCRVLENDLCRTTDERDKLSEKIRRMFDAAAKVHEDVTAEKTRLHSMRESIELESAKFMEELDHLRDTQGHLVEEVEHVYTEKVNVKTTQTKDLRTKETRHLCDKTATMERDFTRRTVCMERQVDEGREVENLSAYLRDIAKIVEDLKAVQVGMKSQHDLIKDSFTQMQNRHENVLHQFEENCQNSTKDLVKMIQEENQRICRLREDLGLCDDLENMWRERVKNDLLGEVEEGLLTTGIRFQLEETITALYATVKTLKNRLTTLERENMKLQARLLRHGEKLTLTHRTHGAKASNDYNAF